MVILFSFTLFVSAFLLFWVQLMVAKMMLPLLGGSPSVWNTCLFFFQATLLFGYAYPHLTTGWLGTRRQAVIHTILLLLPLPFLPITVAMSWVPPQDANPLPWLLALLLLSVGAPFFVVSTSAPLLQKWFANTNHPRSNDPYFLYTASNFGSLLGLFCYPILIEPNFSLTRQSWLWTAGYGLLVLLTIGCAVCLWRSPSKFGSNFVTDELSANETDIPSVTSVTPSVAKQAQWILLSFLPSSLLLGVTTYITTDIAAIPLLWAVPLAIYLLTFILTFAPQPPLPHKTLVALLPLFLTPSIVLFLLWISKPVWLFLPLHLVGFFVAACVFHGELARSRPDAKYLTIFYFWISLGGVLGGLFNAIAAPLLYPSVLEYPLIMLLCLLLLRSPEEKQNPPLKTIADFADVKGLSPELAMKLASISKDAIPTKRSSLRFTLPISIGLLLGILIVGFQAKGFTNNLTGIVIGLGFLIAIRYTFALHPIRLYMGLVSIVLLAQFSILTMGGLLETDRSFFGVNRVVYERRGNYHSLLHGTTLHGKQSLDPQRRNEPLTYFHPTGPIGQLFKSFNNTAKPSNIAVMGLGIGTLAAYSEPGQQWTFYEIDPLVEKLARNTRYFTFLQNSKAPFSVILGDGRLRMAEAPENQYDLIFMDAFSSDSIPIHLVTREAIELYSRKLAKQGLLVINISNRYINLEPVLGDAARSLGLSGLRQLELDISDAERAIGKSPSHWVLLARDRADFGTLIDDSRWQPIPEASNTPLWTDDFSNIFRVLRVFD